MVVRERAVALERLLARLTSVEDVAQLATQGQPEVEADADAQLAVVGVPAERWQEPTLQLAATSSRMTPCSGPSKRERAWRWTYARIAWRAVSPNSAA